MLREKEFIQDSVRLASSPIGMDHDHRGRNVESTVVTTVVVAGISALAAILASSGFWAYMMSRHKLNSASDKLIMGLAYDRLMYLGMKYIERGYITSDEYGDFQKYLYIPYKELGGNGTVERIMSELTNLPIKKHTRLADIVTAKQKGAQRRKEYDDA